MLKKKGADTQVKRSISSKSKLTREYDIPNLNEMSTFEVAGYYVSLGLSVIPIKLDGTKAPACNELKLPINPETGKHSWKAFQERLPTEAEVEDWFLNEDGESEYGIGIVCGEISGGLEVLDVEVKLGGDKFKELQQLISEADSDLLSKLLRVRTPKGGFHYLYYSSVIEGSQKLAQKEIEPKRLETLIETKGEGGYIIAPGSPASSHSLNKSYELRQGSYDAIPIITPQQREILLDCARSFNEYIKSNQFKHCLNPSIDGNRPGDVYNKDPNIFNLASTLLEKYGAVVNGNRVTRPGGIRPSATLFDNGVLYVFSTNYPPFESDMAYSPFSQHVLLKSKGDASNSAKQLYSEGYSQSAKEIDLSTLSLSPDQPIDTVEDVFAAILENLPKRINFKLEAGLGEKEEPGMKEYAVVTAEKILSVSKALNFSFRVRGGKIYVFNSQYWFETDIGRKNIDNLIYFLTDAIERLGLWSVKDKYHTFVESLCKQFITSVLSVPFRQNKTNNVLVNFKNGTLEISEKGYRLRSFDSRDFLTYQLQFDYDLNAKSPKWNKFLDEMLPATKADPDKSRQKVLAEYFASCFTNLNLEKCLFCYGTGDNGKSVIFNVITTLFGKENISHCSLEFLNKQGSYLAVLDNKLLNFSSETSPHFESELFKKLVSREPIEVDEKYVNPFTMTNYARLAFNANELPRTGKEYLHAFKRRFVIIPFDVKITEDKKDSYLASKIIKDELPAVMNWVLEGLDRLLEQGKLTECEASDKEVSRYMKEGDTVAMWLEDESWTEDQKLQKPNECIMLKDLYKDYLGWCSDNKQTRTLGRDQLRRRLADMHNIIHFEYRERQYYRLRKLDMKERDVLNTNNSSEDELDWE
jgi:putative DNA primase/helicase